MAKKIIERELYWVAGFLEGEGCFYLSKRKQYGLAYPMMSASQNYREPLDRVARIFGGNVSLPPSRSKCWIWHLCGKGVSGVMRRIRPLLSRRRREQIDIAIRGEIRRPEGSGSVHRMKTRCPGGHIYDVVRRREDGGLRRSCSICRNFKSRTRYRTDLKYRLDAVRRSAEQRRLRGIHPR
jgi:hypothetical protein